MASKTVTTEDVVTSNEEVVSEEVMYPIPAALDDNKLLVELCKMYLDVAKAIKKYNDSVLTQRTDGWTNAKVLEKARELGNPTDANVKPNDDIKAYLEKYEELLDQLNFAKRELLESTADVLGIVLTNSNERDESVEKPLKEKRTHATVVATQLNNIAGMTHDTTVTEAIKEFLEKNPLPMVGRDQVRTFTDGSAGSTPRYRVDVKVFKGDDLIGTAQGFTKAGLMVTRPEFGFVRGKAISGDKLREAYEGAGNSAANPYAVSPVEFVVEKGDDLADDLKFVIEKRA